MLQALFLSSWAYLAISVCGIQAPAPNTKSTEMEKTKGYTIPGEPVKLESGASQQALLLARRVALITIERPAITFGSQSGSTIHMTVHGGIKRKVDEGKAKTELDKALKKWGRYTVVADPSEADLVFVLVDESVPPSGFSQKVAKDTKYRLKDTLAVFRGGNQEEAKRQAIWMHAESENTLSVFSGSLSDKIVAELRKEVESVEKESKK